MIEEDTKPHDVSREEIHDGSEIHPSTLERNVGEVRYPNVILVLGMVRHEEVRVDIRLLLWFMPFLASPTVWLDTEVLHHSSYTFLVDLEVYSEPFVTVCRVYTEHLFNLYLEDPVFVGHLGSIV